MVLLTIILFILILGLLVFVHELGHFLVAKRSGMTVEEFGFGFPPRIFGFRKTAGKWEIVWGSKASQTAQTAGSTIYSVNWIPLGGFVKILGENGDSRDPGAFSSKSAFRRFLVLIAGVSMNAVLAWVLLSATLVIGLPTQVGSGEQFPQSARVTDKQVAIVYVEPDSPAQNAGMRAGDSVISVDGNPIAEVQQMIDYTSLNAGKPLEYEIKRGSEFLSITAVPRTNPPEGSGALGVQPALVANIAYPWHEAIIRGAGITLSLITQILFAFGRLIGSLFTENSLAASLTGPVGIAVLTRDAARLGLANLMYFTAVLSVNLAIINALPFPALDGGRVLFLAIEKIRRKPINMLVEGYANTIGFFLLIVLLIWISARDVGRYSEQFGNLWRKIIGLFG